MYTNPSGIEAASLPRGVGDSAESGPAGRGRRYALLFAKLFDHCRRKLITQISGSFQVIAGANRISHINFYQTLPRYASGYLGSISIALLKSSMAFLFSFNLPSEFPLPL